MYKYPTNKAVCLTILNYSDLLNKIIPFFKKYPILGVKNLDFQDWCTISKLIEDKQHLTNEGMETIKKIKSGMNTGRK